MVAHCPDIADGSDVADRVNVATVVVGASGLGAITYIALRDPSTGGAFLPCPLHAVTGLWCPACGSTRGFHSLLRGHVGEALAYNALLPLFLVLGLLIWVDWMQRARLPPRRRILDRLPTRTWIAVAVVAFTFGVARNLPWAPFSALAP